MVGTVTNTFPHTQITPFHCLLAAIFFQITNCTIVHCQTIQPVAETDEHAVETESATVVAATALFPPPANNHRQPRTSDSHFNWDFEVQADMPTNHAPAANPTWDFEVQADMPANHAPAAKPTWDFEVQAAIPPPPIGDSPVAEDVEQRPANDARPHSLTKSPERPMHQVRAAAPCTGKLIYQPAVPSVDNQGRVVLKPKVWRLTLPYR